MKKEKKPLATRFNKIKKEKRDLVQKIASNELVRIPIDSQDFVPPKDDGSTCKFCTRSFGFSGGRCVPLGEDPQRYKVLYHCYYLLLS